MAFVFSIMDACFFFSFLFPFLPLSACAFFLFLLLAFRDQDRRHAFAKLVLLGDREHGLA